MPSEVLGLLTADLGDVVFHGGNCAPDQHKLDEDLRKCIIGTVLDYSVWYDGRLLVNTSWRAQLRRNGGRRRHAATTIVGAEQSLEIAVEVAVASEWSFSWADAGPARSHPQITPQIAEDAP